MAPRDRTRDETEDEKSDRRYDELLQELRVAQTGVQFLFAFLLTLAFTQRFGRITEFQLRLYIGTLMATTVAHYSSARCPYTAAWSVAGSSHGWSGAPT
jgi:hypothetical protein